MVYRMKSFGLYSNCPKTGKAKLERDLVVIDENCKPVIVVPKGFLTDFYSVPWFVRWLAPRWDAFADAAVVHDYLCEKHGFSRDQADKIFYWLLRSLGVSRLKGWLLYIGVRIGAYYDKLKHFLTGA